MITIERAVYEFYALEALNVLAKPEAMKPSHAVWVRDFQEYRKAYNGRLSLAMRDYLAKASFAEARHFRHCYGRIAELEPFGSEDRDAAMYGATDFTPESISTSCAALFGDYSWSGAFGGKSWAKIARAISLYGTVDNTVFIDHCVDLSHNNGIVFNKNEAGIFCVTNPALYKSTLDWKAKATPRVVLSRSPISTKLILLLRRAIVLEIVKAYCDGPERRTDPFEYNKAKEFEWLMDQYKPIAWGTRVLSAPCVNPNPPKPKPAQKPAEKCPICGNPCSCGKLHFYKGVMVCQPCKQGAENNAATVAKAQVVEPPVAVKPPPPTKQVVLSDFTTIYAPVRVAKDMEEPQE